MAPPKTATIPQPVLEVLSGATCEGNVLKLTGQLDRPLYERVNAVLVDLGGKWNRKLRGHVFPGDAAERVDQAVLTGGYVSARANAYFPTPPALVARLIELAGIAPGQCVLEPSAGQGAIADAITAALGHRPDVVELLPENQAALRKKGYKDIVAYDFLEYGLQDHSAFYDRIVMNPPFDRGQDVRHVRHAWGMLVPGGRLVAVMAAGITFRQDAGHRALRELIETHGGLEPNPPGTFSQAGTEVNTVTVFMDAAP